MCSGSVPVAFRVSSGRIPVTRPTRSGAQGPRDQPGIIPRALAELFAFVGSCASECHVTLSYLELYNEELIDLLAPDQTATLQARLACFPLPSAGPAFRCVSLVPDVTASAAEMPALPHRASAAASFRRAP